MGYLFGDHLLKAYNKVLDNKGGVGMGNSSELLGQSERVGVQKLRGLRQPSLVMRLSTWKNLDAVLGFLVCGIRQPYHRETKDESREE